MALKLLSLKGVIEITSLSKSSIYRLVRAGQFPKSQHITAGRVVWRLDAVSQWIQSNTSV
jgi:prophage regulatory protein